MELEVPPGGGLRQDVDTLEPARPGAPLVTVAVLGAASLYALL